MAEQIQHDLGTLKALLAGLAQLDHEHECVSRPEAAELQAAFRDCRLELLRLIPAQVSEEQRHRLNQMEARLDLVARYGAFPDSIGPEAKLALASFGWPTNT